jgi:hypothetical protein
MQRPHACTVSTTGPADVEMSFSRMILLLLFSITAGTAQLAVCYLD